MIREITSEGEVIEFDSMSPLDGSRRETVRVPPPPAPSRGKRIANLLRWLARDAETMSDAELDEVQAHVDSLQHRIAVPTGVFG